MEIKRLGPEDLHLLDAVAPGVFDDPIDRTRAGEFLADPRHRLVAAVDRLLVVGFVSGVIYLHPDKARPELWINEVGVSPAHQRRNIGKRLLEAIFDEARRAGCLEAWVLTDRTNIPAMKLYGRFVDESTATDHVMFTFRWETSGAE